jgi:hypothetical protein
MQMWFIDKYPGTIPAIAALVGVLVGLFGNAYLQSRDRRSKRRHEREALRRALTAELRWLLSQVRERLPLLTGERDPVPIYLSVQMYDQLPERIGLLKPREGEQVIDAYLGAKYLAIDLRRLARRTDLPEKDINEDYIVVHPNHKDNAIRLHRERIKLFKRAIRALGGNVDDDPIDELKQVQQPISTTTAST